MKAPGRTLEERTRALRLRLLADLGRLTVDSSDDDIRRMDRRWWYVRKRITTEATEPGESARLYAAMVVTEELQRFFMLRSAYRARNREYRRRVSRRYYERVLRAQRSTPEARADLAEARRRQRAARKAT